jgi:hypothetical protein
MVLNKEHFDEAIIALEYTKVGMTHNPQISFVSSKINNEYGLTYMPASVCILSIIRLIKPYVASGRLPYRPIHHLDGITNY